MSHRPRLLSALLIGTSLLVTACSTAAPMTEQETQIKSDLATDNFLPATRQMREAIETQPLFAQAAFWSNEYHLNPADLEAAIKLSAAVRKLGNPGKAVEITQTTRALYPRDPYLMAEYSAALIASERSDEALTYLDQGIAATPSYGRLWSLKGAALDQQERYAEARQNYDRALRITPNDPNVMTNIGLSYALSGDLNTAEGWLRKAAAMPNASPSVKQNLAIILQLQGKTGEAEQYAPQSRPATTTAQIRPAYNAAPNQARANQYAAPQSQAPQYAGAPTQTFQQGQMPRARLSTGPSEGQSYKSASEAARAMAMKRSQQQTVTQQPQQQAYTQPAATAAQNYPQQGYAQQGYPQPQYGSGLAGAPQQSAPERRTANRRRR